MSKSLEITGHILERYILAAALLRLLDPVRGEPTAYSLDQESSSVLNPGELVLKRKFLDSFALICATIKDGDSVSAACLEEGQPEGTVFRIASNAGVPESVFAKLQDILKSLEAIAIGASNTSISESEIEVLRQIVTLNISKIREYVKCLKKAKKITNADVDNITSRISSALPNASPAFVQESSEFTDWLSKLSSIDDFNVIPDADVLLGWVRWAQKARSTHLSLLKAVLSKPNKPLPRWISYIFKLGRYGIAAKVFVTIACRIPGLFNPIRLEAIPAPRKVHFSIPKDELPLTTVLRRVPEIKVDETIPRLASIWNVDDAERLFRKDCHAELATHAELQLVSFYDDNPWLKPSSLFIGVSKKSCYLCSTFLSVHPDGFAVSSCHQKMYLSIPPPALSLKVYKRFKLLTNTLSERMETIARHDLTRRLGIKRLPGPADSTAGVSLSGLTQSRFAEDSGFEIITNTEVNSEAKRGTEAIFPTSDEAISTIFDNFASTRNSRGHISGAFGRHAPSTSRLDVHNLQEAIPYRISSQALYSVVFHCTVQDDDSRQDIIMIGSCLDPLTRSPSWLKFVELLNSEDGLGIDFREFDYFTINNRIRVRNERQFIAGLQYLLNSGELNAEVMICGGRTTSPVPSNKNK